MGSAPTRKGVSKTCHRAHIRSNCIATTHNDQFTKDGTELPKLLGECSSVNSINGRNAALLKPLRKGFLSRPMRVFPGVLADHKTGNVDFFALKVQGKTVFVQYGFIRNTVVANQGVGQNKNLTPIRRIGQRLRIANHSSVKDHLTRHGFGSTKGMTRDGFRTIRQIEHRRVTLT